MRTLLACLLLLGCEPPESKNPLSDPAAAKRETRLVGTWKGTVNKRECWLHVAPGKDASIDLVLVIHDNDGVGTLVFDAFPSLIGGKSYLNLRSKTFHDRWAEKHTLSEGFLFARYAVNKDGSVTLFAMEEDPIKAAVKANQLEGHLEGDNVKLSGSTAALAAFVAKSDDKLFKLFGTFRRVKG